MIHEGFEDYNHITILFDKHRSYVSQVFHSVLMKTVNMFEFWTMACSDRVHMTEYFVLCGKVSSHKRSKTKLNH